MGNKLGQGLREKYVRGEFQEVLSHNDASLGGYRIIRFGAPHNAFCLTKTLDPCAYDQYSSDIDEFTRRLTKAHGNMCEFLFVEPNARDARLYDLVFEFGDFVNTGFQNERVIWTFVEHVLAALLFLQAEGFHYPALRKKYTVYQSSASAFKLLNPNCFPGHVEDAIGLYLNPERKVSEKRAALQQHVNRNVKELGVMVLALTTGREESAYFKSPSTIRAAVAELRASGHYTARLINFLAFTIENRAVLGFGEVREFLSADVGGLAEERFRQGHLAAAPPASPGGAAGAKPALQQKGSLPARSAQAGGLEPVALPLAELSVARKPKSATPPSGSEPGPAPFSSGKKVRRIVARWSQETNTHREFVEYVDGSVEERPRAGEAPTAPPPQESVAWTLLLFTDEADDAGRVLLTAHVPSRFDQFAPMQGVVDRTQALRPALYHAC